MDLIFFNTPGASEIDFGKPVYQRIWLSTVADMTSVVLEVYQRASTEISTIYFEDCLTVKREELPESASAFTVQVPVIPSPVRRIAFFSASDTLSFLLSPVILKLQEKNNHIQTLAWHRINPNVRAKEGFESNEVKSTRFSFFRFLWHRPDILVMGNDWTMDAQLLIALGRWLGIRTVCIQESVIDLVDKKIARMRWADFALLQGAVAAGQVPERQMVFLTGNPRYEKLKFQQPRNTQPFFLVNCNFTYGLYEDQRQNWLNPVIELLETLNLDYVIAQHPRDSGDLSGYKNVVQTNAAVIHELIERSDCIISRFSSVLHEGLFLGKRAVYFNPHGESIGYDYGFDGSALSYATNKNELLQALNRILEASESGPAVFKPYLEKNCHHGLGIPSETIAALLPDLMAMKGDGKPISMFRVLLGTIKFYYFSKKKQR
ncbi:MAG: hypothetical protein HUU01_18240 [Saprospiraceae bacterium]|nr:hypothetical protein [Saprospiraceae bacterium]